MNDERGNTREDEVLEMLKRANPVQEGEPDEARAERILSAATGSRAANRRRWYAGTAVGAAAAIAALAIGVFAFAGGDDGDGGAVVENPDDTGGGFAATCIGFSDEELRLREFAFSGTATSVDGPMVTFAVDQWLKGPGHESFTLELDSTLQNSLYTEFTVAEGERYLVSGEAGFAWGCGFTVPYDEGAAQQWGSALAS